MVKLHCHCSKTLLEKTVKRVAVTKVGTPVAMTMLAGMVTNTFYNFIGRLKRVAPLEHMSSISFPDLQGTLSSVAHYLFKADTLIGMLTIPGI